MPAHPKLFSKVALGPYSLPHRIAMAPMTRNRASAGNVPNALMAKYYSQRAGAAVIVTEATQVAPLGQGYPLTPGIHSADQVQGWRAITQAVHAAGGRIFLQLWHVGRISHPVYHGGALPVAPSAIKPAGQCVTMEGMKDFVTPRALETHEIAGIVEEFRKGARNALDAGFDGVEIHGANGYLVDQFIRDGTNQRTDRYGGSIENRARFALEVVDAVIGVWGSDRVAIRLSPSGTFNDMKDSNPEATFSYVVKQLRSRKLAYLHLMEAMPGDLRHEGKTIPVDFFREIYPGTIMVNSAYDAAKAEAVVARGAADLVSFGALFLANPDLPERFRKGAALNEPNPATFYGGDEKGYTDYPALKT